jgi:hypothetical protein
MTVLAQRTTDNFVLQGDLGHPYHLRLEVLDGEKRLHGTIKVDAYQDGDSADLWDIKKEIKANADKIKHVGTDAGLYSPLKSVPEENARVSFIGNPKF